MNSKTAKQLRRFAGVRGQLVQYEPPVLLRMASIPTYDRIMREMQPNGQVTSRVVNKIRLRGPKRAPRLLMDAKGEPKLTLIPVAAPRKLVPGSPRHEYHELKKCARLPC